MPDKPLGNMEKLFSIDIFQTLSYLMPGLALLIPIYLATSDVINAMLQRAGSITALVLIIPASFSIGIFLHAVSASAQHQIENSLKHIGAIKYNMTERTVEQFQYRDQLLERIQAAYKIELDRNNHTDTYIYSRTLVMKDGIKFYEQAQFYSASSVFCRSLILVSLIIGATLIWRYAGKNRRGLVLTVLTLVIVIPSLVHIKEMHYRLSVHEVLRAALLLAVDKN